MKKWFFRIVKVGSILIGILLIVLLIAGFVSERDAAVIEKYIKNDNLPTIKEGWKGTPLDQKGRFVNVEFPFLPKMSQLLKWQLGEKPFKEEKQKDEWRIEVKDPTEFLNSDRDGIVWFGHAAFLIRLEGVNILLDPTFGKPTFVRTYVDVPSPLEKIKRVDYILVSHDHRDHCDEDSIRQTAQKFPNAKILGGLRMDELFNEWKTASNEVQTAGWYQQFSLSDEKVKIFFLPVRHWSRRGLFDTNHRLWGGYVIQGAGKTIYFSGDSGFGSHYKEAGELFPQIDYFIIGIGAYEPRWFMEPNHNTPAEAFQAFVDAKAKTLIPMHYGRFDLSDEPPSQPLRLLREKAEAENLADKIRALSIGEHISFKE
jgi:L-ascorbate metabolism protein UlaG (beta-lactamase superfamily)